MTTPLRSDDLEGWVAETRARLARHAGLDRLRGLAVLLMLVDHVALVAGGHDGVRLTIGRLAMPLFFLVSGHLSGRVSPRVLGIAGLGVVMAVLVPWAGSPSILTVYAVGVGVLAAARWFGLPVWLFPVVALSVMANGWAWRPGAGYDVFGLVGIMAVGAMFPRTLFDRGGYLPAWVGVVGRYPLSIYVGHLLALQAWLVAVR